MFVMDELLEFRPSPIHGVGGFALRDIAAGARIIEYTGEKISKRESLARCERGNSSVFHLDEQWNLDGHVDGNPARFLNHSCSPNCDAERIDGRIWIVATRAIRAGDEITFNYSYDLIDYREHPCRCGSAECVGFMVAEEFFAYLRARRAIDVPKP